VARLGGDEFVLVVEDLNTDKADATLQAKIIAEKISSSLAEPYRLAVAQAGANESVEHHSSASIGVVVFIDSEGSQDDFLKWADAAMYRAKEAGHGLIRFPVIGV
jgi:diguanylate cyclase (GGDEF)-like protein